MRVLTATILFVLLSGVIFLGPVQSQVIAQDTLSLSEKLTTDQVEVLFCSYFGGVGEEWSNDIAFLSDGSIILTGQTKSNDIPVVDAHQSEYGGAGDMFMVKLSHQFQVEFYTYFGGSGEEEPMAIAVDSEDNIIVAGGTSSANMTTLNPIQSELNGTSDIFVAKFDSSGNLLFSTYLGGSDGERAESLQIGEDGEYLIVGRVDSPDFYTTPGVYQETFGGGNSDAFITSLSEDGQTIYYSTYFGSINDEDGLDIGVDALGNLVVVGLAFDATITTGSAYQQTYGGGDTDAFVAKFSPNCTSLLWSTLLGGSGWEFGDRVDFDSNNDVVVSGYTGSSDFPLVDQLYNDTGSYDAFFARLTANGEDLTLSSYLGGSLEDRSYSMEVLEDDSILITSPSASPDMPVANQIMNHTDDSDGYLGLIGGESLTLLFGSHFGGSNNDYVLGHDVYDDDMIAVIGYTYSNDLPVVNEVQESYGGFSDTMVWVFGFSDMTTPPPIDGPPPIPPIIVAGVLVAVVAVVFIVLRRK